MTSTPASSAPHAPSTSLDDTPPTPASPAADGAGSRPACVDSKALLRGYKAVEISHNGATYRLQATRLGKLILTK